MLVAALVGTLVAAGGFAFLYQSTDIPDPNEDFQTQTSFVYYADGKDEVGRFATQNRVSIKLGEMPQTMQDAVVAGENRTFWTDPGIDPKGILRAAFSNAKGNATQGASTITQQYVKILYLTSEQKLKRKAKEAVLSLKIQRQLSKSQILEGYLNTIYFGRGAYGVQAAAQAYFAKPAKRLNLRESAVLASVLNNPLRLDPDNGKEARATLKERYSYVLGSMAEMGTITSDKAERAGRRLPKFPEIAAQSQYGGQKGHLLTMVRKELQKLGFSDEEIDGGGLRVTTTFTKKAMDAAAAGVAAQRPEGFGANLHVGVASVEPGTGAVRGFFGGQDFLDSQINWAQAGGMAGSTFKAFAISAAIKDGYSLKDTFEGNSPYLLPDGSDVENQGDSDYGSAVSMVQATEDSINTAFIDMTLGMDDGPQKIIQTANEMGIPPAEARSAKGPGFPNNTRDLQPNTGVALGTAVVSPINLANAYATIANGGVHSEPFVIDKVVDRYGETRYNHKVVNKRALDEDVAADVSYALQQVVASGSGTAALGLNRPAAGKTGTATNDKGGVSSAWFVGYTPQLSTAVMYVRGNGREALDGWLPTFFGGAYPADTWTDIMTRMMEGLEIEEFPEPAYVDGDAPEEGHAPYVPPPPPPEPTKATKAPTSKPPTKAPSKPPTKAPSKSPTQEPTQEPTSEPTDCTILGNCPSQQPSPTSSGPPSPTKSN